MRWRAALRAPLGLVAAGRPWPAMSEGIRGNTDESWLRGDTYLAKNKLLAENESR